jgi:hypothetical protein
MRSGVQELPELRNETAASGRWLVFTWVQATSSYIRAPIPGVCLLNSGTFCNS